VPNRGKKFGNASQVTTHIDDYGGMKGYAHGGAVNPQAKQNKVPMPKPEKAAGGPPKKITTPGKPGDSGPGGAHPGRNRPKKMAGGGMSYADGGKAKKKVSKKPRKPKPEMLGTGTAAGAGRALSGRQRQIDKALEDAGA
jgi:hypothetical protein